MESILEIVHVPLGIEDPYTLQPWERSPRFPQDGDAVEVAFVTRPHGEIIQASVQVEVKGQEPRGARACRLAWEGEGDRWTAALGEFVAADHVSYRIKALSVDGEDYISGPYAFDVAGWHHLAPITWWKASPSGAILYLGNEEGMVTIEILGDDLARLRVYPLRRDEPSEDVSAVPCRIHEEDGNVIVRGASLEVQVTLVDGSVIVAAPESHGAAVHTPPGEPLVSWVGLTPDCPHAVRLRLGLAEHEALYGSGERFDRFDRRGLRFDARVYEQYKNQGSRTYLPVPMMLSSRGYAVSIGGTRPLCIDAGASRNDALEIDAEVARDSTAGLEVSLFLADAPLQALQAYLERAGVPVVPPDWAFGLWMSSNDWNSQELVMREVERSETEGIEADVLVIEAWSDEATFYIWNDARYPPLPPDRAPRLSDFSFPVDGHWPDPVGMIHALHDRGMHVLLWQIPLLKQTTGLHDQNERDAETLISNEWCASNADGSPYRNPGWWFTGALLPDFTHPGAVEWWLSRRRYLVQDMGIDGFKTDGGEHIWGHDLLFGDGRRGDEMINAFPVLYSAVYHALLRQGGRDDTLTFSRAGYAGSQRFPAHWAGDENSTWEAFRHSIVAGLSAGASGIPFWGWDIAGFSGEIPDGELYRRAWMMATFCPIMQYHSEYNARRSPSRDRTPWNIAERTGDPHVLPVCRRFARLRRELRPYIVREARHTAETGRPLMCALPLAYPDDARCHAYPYQYLFGRDLLVAPTVEAGLVRQQVYLPAEEWLDFWTGEPVMGPAERMVDVPPDRIPVYARRRAGPLLDRWLKGDS